MTNVTYDVLSTNAIANYEFSPPLTASDREGNAVTYSLSPADMTVFSLDSATGVLKLLSAIAVSLQLTVTVTDSQGLSSLGYVSVVIVPYSGLAVSAIAIPTSGFVRTVGGDSISFAVRGLLGVPANASFTGVYSNSQRTLGPVVCSNFANASLLCPTVQVRATPMSHALAHARL